MRRLSGQQFLIPYTQKSSLISVRDKQRKRISLFPQLKQIDFDKHYKSDARIAVVRNAGTLVDLQKLRNLASSQTASCGDHASPSPRRSSWQ